MSGQKHRWLQSQNTGGNRLRPSSSLRLSNTLSSSRLGNQRAREGGWSAPAGTTAGAIKRPSS
ncbi:uncharacterized protein GLRG_03778 [Colletotrichum graminicola M1.001]|uniref:Uncharacterized protein n=1 Tax=Colletotrichum graminicola (strain M1.001 / M2 / FGSC 10212) TaxID=645133 RepID=E3QCP6_COLGM|nr:uncharacterized protein GLRG_03778 [Colletotrichum graminicola M1.001]EFQ28634.1 hypothetical protein GLRG_03778 [Colletotrichum graminicola M1.001]